LREISALSELRGNDNIVELLDVFEIENSKKAVLSFKYEEGGDLNGLLHKLRKFK
jgi:serine/threonine protein kinase